MTLDGSLPPARQPARRAQFVYWSPTGNGRSRRPAGRIRLLTLTGAGGCGKTRLALQVAGGLQERYPDSVWLVEFAPLADDELVSQALAAVLGVREQPGQSLSASLIEYLHHRELLLLYTHPQQARLFVAGANRYLGD